MDIAQRIRINMLCLRREAKKNVDGRSPELAMAYEEGVRDAFQAFKRGLYVKGKS